MVTPYTHVFLSTYFCCKQYLLRIFIYKIVFALYVRNVRITRYVFAVAFTAFLVKTVKKDSRSMQNVKFVLEFKKKFFNFYSKSYLLFVLYSMKF